MSPLDILILAVLGVGAFLGFKRGIVAQIGQIAAVIAGIAMGRVFGASLATAFGGDNPSAFNYVCSYIAVFVIAYAAVLLVAKVVRGTVHTLCLGIVDRLAGAVFKAAEWLLLLSIALNIYFLISGGEGDTRQADKPWRAAAIDFAPAVMGYLSLFNNLDGNQSVKE